MLLIEDESTTARAIELMLTSEGFNVYSTDLGEEGLDHLKVLLDRSMFAFEFLGPTFTMSLLRNVHEIILGRELEPILFRKRMIGRIFPGERRLIKVEEQQLTGGRPAQLYRLGYRS